MKEHDSECISCKFLGECEDCLNNPLTTREQELLEIRIILDEIIKRIAKIVGQNE